MRKLLNILLIMLCVCFGWTTAIMPVGGEKLYAIFLLLLISYGIGTIIDEYYKRY